MKAYKTILTITMILIIIAVTLIATIGINKKEDYRVVNVIPSYKLGMELSKSKVFTFAVSDEVKETKIYDAEGNLVTNEEEGVEYTEANGYKTEEIKANDASKLTSENYKANKKIFEKRLKELGVEQYKIQFDETNGTITVEVPNNDNADNIATYLKYSGTIKLLDDDTDEVVLDSSYVKNAKLIYGSKENDENKMEYYVYLQVEYNKDGIAKIKELSKTYISTTTQETDENGETKDVTTDKKVDVVLNGTSVGTTVITNLVYGDTLAICLGYSTDTEEFANYEKNASAVSIALNSGELSLEYTVSNEEKENSISNTTKIIALSIAGVIFLGLSIYAIIKFKGKGLLAIILEIGYIAIILLVVRTLKIILTPEGFLGLAISGLLNYSFLFIMLKNLKENNVWRATTKTMLEFLIKTVPITIIAVAFSFVIVDNVNSLGMTLVWGIMICYLYNLAFTNTIYTLVGGKK